MSAIGTILNAIILVDINFRLRIYLFLFNFYTVDAISLTKFHVVNDFCKMKCFYMTLVWRKTKYIKHVFEKRDCKICEKLLLDFNKQIIKSY